MTINAPAAILLAFYVVAAEEKGIAPEQLGGTIQTDILKEYIAQKEWCFPIEPAMRLVTDMVEWCTAEMPRWHPISISGYHIREAGSTAPAGARVHAQGRLHLRRAGDRARARRRRLRPPPELLLQRPHRLLRGDRQVPRGAPDLGARDARHLRRQATRASHADALPHPDRRRLADRPAAAGQHRPDRRSRRSPASSAGPSRLHTNSYDEALALPTEEAVRIALRTQQVIAHESGVTNTADPLGGSYFVEKLTDEMEAAAYDYFARIDELGGMVAAIKRGFPAARDRRRRVSLPARGRPRRADRGRRQRLPAARTSSREIHRPDPDAEAPPAARLEQTRAARDAAAVEPAPRRGQARRRDRRRT